MASNDEIYKLLGALDERTKAIYCVTTKLESALDKQESRLCAVEAWRISALGAMAGASAVVTAVFAVAISAWDWLSSIGKHG